MIGMSKQLQFAPPKRIVFGSREKTDCKKQKPIDFRFPGGLLGGPPKFDRIRILTCVQLTAIPEDAFSRAWFGLRNAHRVAVFKGHEEERTDFIIAMIKALSESNNACAGRVLAGAIKRYRGNKAIEKALSSALANSGLNIHIRALRAIWHGRNNTNITDVPKEYRQDLELFLERYPEETPCVQLLSKSFSS